MLVLFYDLKLKKLNLNIKKNYNSKNFLKYQWINKIKKPIKIQKLNKKIFKNFFKNN